MKETLRLIDMAIEALRKSDIGHVMLHELERCRSELMQFAKYELRRNENMRIIGELFAHCDAVRNDPVSLYNACPRRLAK